jgi:UDP-glucose 4-epimerase
MRILVTGASGHVGGAIAARLQAHGHEVVAMVNRRPAKGHFQESYRFDIAKQAFVDAAQRSIDPCEGVVHAAACLDTDALAESVSLCNCYGTQQLLRLAKSWNSRCFVFISSIGVIGKPRHTPITENHPTDPLTAYHASKLYGEHLVRVATDGTMVGVSLRVSAPVGPGTPENRILPVFVRSALANGTIVIHGNGTRCQNYVDVRDIARLVERALACEESGVFNAAGNESISNVDLARMCIRKLGSRSTIEFSGCRDSQDGDVWDVSMTKAREVLGYEAVYSIEDSIDAMVAYDATGVC